MNACENITRKFRLFQNKKNNNKDLLAETLKEINIFTVDVQYIHVFEY